MWLSVWWAGERRGHCIALKFENFKFEKRMDIYYLPVLRSGCNNSRIYGSKSKIRWWQCGTMDYI